MDAGEASVVALLADGAPVVVVLFDAVAEERDVVLLAVVGVEVAGGAGEDVEAGLAGIVASEADCSAVVVVAVDAAAEGSGVSEVGGGAEGAVGCVTLAGHALVGADGADWVVDHAEEAVGAGTA